MFLIAAIVDAVKASFAGIPVSPEPVGLTLQVGTTADDRVWLCIGGREYVLGSEAALWLGDRMRQKGIEAAFAEEGMGLPGVRR